MRCLIISPKRSKHSEERRSEGRRVIPTFNDAQIAKQSDIFLQSDGRYVLRSKKGREHIFEPDGELVTTINRTQKAHQIKLRRGERRIVTEEEFEIFQDLFR
ncbi:hypothetical protein [Oscillatoria salina]|uniref:hypothetical protein n=1 Tax=Oscillatoria salina TaxID=331517 RepID=UPI0013B82AD8|nr:hypothetical protein [Oscillatoria salina]MBZ8182240.1 hypothetical protein [Oscillatoria salina IIICB1]NET91138.1 hypothetical protein [Kamptonema sp. SIO1D9]